MESSFAKKRLAERFVYFQWSLIKLKMFFLFMAHGILPLHLFLRFTSFNVQHNYLGFSKR